MDSDEAAAVGGKVVRVASIAALNAELEKHKNIGLLAIISHGGLDGTVRIGGANEKLDTITAALTKRGAGTIDRVQFLGCNIGRDTGGMKTLKGQVGASAVEGVNCFLETQRLSPARRQGGQGKAILTADDLPPGMTKAQFGGLLKTLIPGDVDVNNHKIANRTAPSDSPRARSSPRWTRRSWPTSTSPATAASSSARPRAGRAGRT